MRARAKKHIGFRLDTEQLDQFEQLVAKSGLTAQDYCVDRVLSCQQPEVNQLDVIRALTETIRSQQETIDRLTKKSAKSLQDSEKIKGIEATKILGSIDPKRHRERNIIYYGGSLYWVSKSPNGCQDVLEKYPLEIPTELARRWEKMIYAISPKKLDEATELYNKLVQIPGFNQVGEESRKWLVGDCLRAADYGGAGEGWLVEAESTVKQHLFQALAHTHTDDVLTPVLDGKNLPNPEPEPDSGVDKLLADAIEVDEDVAESIAVSEETVLTQDSVPTEGLSRDAFASRYGLDVSNQSYNKVLTAAKSTDGWTSPDGLVWFATGTKAKTLWKANKVLAKV